MQRVEYHQSKSGELKQLRPDVDHQTTGALAESKD